MQWSGASASFGLGVFAAVGCGSHASDAPVPKSAGASIGSSDAASDADGIAPADSGTCRVGDDQVSCPSGSVCACGPQNVCNPATVCITYAASVAASLPCGAIRCGDGCFCADNAINTCLCYSGG